MAPEPRLQPPRADEPDQQRIDDLLRACAENDAEASGRLFAFLYHDLKRLARRQLGREHDAHTLGATALVHETYLKFSGGQGAAWESRAHFLAIASRAMRQVLIDHARRRAAQKRGGGQVQVTLRTDPGAAAASCSLDVIALSEALDRLGEHDERLVRLVECRFFGGLTAEETAAALGMSLRTVERDWTRARLYLAHLLQPAGGA